MSIATVIEVMRETCLFFFPALLSFEVSLLTIWKEMGVSSRGAQRERDPSCASPLCLPTWASHRRVSTAGTFVLTEV